MKKESSMDRIDSKVSLNKKLSMREAMDPVELENK